jgi:hypothetical protein
VDHILAQIYTQKLVSYDTKGSRLLDRMKVALMRDHQYTFRPDASVCLLSLYDQMIVVPYSERLKFGPLFTSEGTSPMTAQDFDLRVMESFNLLVQTIETNKSELASSHDVIKAINSVWGSLSSYFKWG